MKVGLFFGSFNPIHVGHLILANHILGEAKLDQLWFVVSPHNPLKDKKTLLADHHRLAMVELAIADNENFRASNVEFKLPQPNYTVVTLAALKEKHPTYEFSIIMGEDNLRTIHKWYNYEQILENYPIIVYPRIHNSGEEFQEEGISTITLLKEVPMMDISSTFIRKAIKEKKSVKYLLTDAVYEYIDKMNFYKK